MANLMVAKRGEQMFPSSIFDPLNGENMKSRGQLVERKIEVLESLAGKVSNRRSRRWLNDRLLIELVPRLNVEEIRGLFAPPPFGDDTPLSAFTMTNGRDWDPFRNVDMDAEANMMQSLETPLKRKGDVNNDKITALNAWRRIDCRTREVLRRHYLSDLVAGYEERIRAFVKDAGEVLVLHVQDPFHRLLLHGVCEYYNLISVTLSSPKGEKLWKTTEIKKRLGADDILPNITLSGFLKMAKEGIL